MSKELSKFQFSLDQCEQELAEFGALLDSKDELSEKNDLLPFFGPRPHLATFAASWNLRIEEIDLFGFELDLFGNFRCDWAAGHSQSGEFVLGELTEFLLRIWPLRTMPSTDSKFDNAEQDIW